jgi:hypothetical protein
MDQKYFQEIRETNPNSLNWRSISLYQSLPEELIRECKDNVRWELISSAQELSEDFIREFRYCVDWTAISEYQKLSEDFIREFSDVLDWEKISKYQKLSEDFIREFSDCVKWNFLSHYNTKRLSDDFYKEFAFQLGLTINDPSDPDVILAKQIFEALDKATEYNSYYSLWNIIHKAEGVEVIAKTLKENRAFSTSQNAEV